MRERAMSRCARPMAGHAKVDEGALCTTEFVSGGGVGSHLCLLFHDRLPPDGGKKGVKLRGCGQCTRLIVRARPTGLCRQRAVTMSGPWHR